MTATTDNTTRRSRPLNDLFLLAMMTAMTGILTVAMVLQFRDGEIPCPLCLLQRVAMFGVCFGIVLHFREGYSARNDGLSIAFALLLLIVAGRQVLLDITPRPGHDYIGSAVFGLHMPVWSVLIALAILIAFAAKLAVLGDEARDDTSSAALTRIGGFVSLYVIALGVINLVAVVLQCGLDACHTTGYRLL